MSIPRHDSSLDTNRLAQGPTLGETPSSVDAPAREVESRPVTWRGVLIGLGGVTIISAVAPFNDWVLGNTPFIGNFLPVGLLILLLAFLLFVQGPLRRFAPDRALRRSDVSIILAMWLVGCAVPTSGFMRYVPATIIAIHAHAAETPGYAIMVDDAKLPAWLLPRFDTTSAASRGREPVVTDYVARSQSERQHWSDYISAVPWGRWLVPTFTWGLFAIGLLGIGLLIPIIVQRQWVQNERLPFPLATVYLSLIEPPHPGRTFNALFSSRLFWLAAAAVFCFHLWNGLGVYAPRYVPKLPTGFNLHSMLADPPLSQLEWYFKRASIYFSVIGITFFMHSKVSFSLWSWVVLLQLVVLGLGARNAELTSGMRLDQSTGAVVATAAATLFVGRNHFAMVVRQMLRGARSDEPRGEFIPYAWAGWLLVLCCALVAAWVAAIGLSRPNLTWEMGVWSVAAGLLTCCAAVTVITVIYRAVAETGLPFVQLAFAPTRFFVYFQQFSPASIRVDPGNYFHTAWLSQCTLQDLRESLAPFAGHALRILDTSTPQPRTRWNGAALLGALVLSLLTAYFVSGAAMLMVEYNFSTTASLTSTSDILNKWVMVDSTQGMLRSVQGFLSSGGSEVRHSVLLHLAIGAGITLLLAGGRLRFNWWPLYPIGLLLVHTYVMQVFWFSILIGWLIKIAIVRLGGAPALRELRPIFLGLIIGEACAAGFWLLSGAMMQAMGFEFRIVQLLPT
jgi:hypothetical protein